MNNKKNRQLIDEHIHAYICQSIVSLLCDVIVLIALWIVAILMFSKNTIEHTKNNILFFCLISVVYIILACVINHRVLIAVLVDKMQNNVVTETISPTELKEDAPFKSYQITNNITIFYNKEMNVKKYKLFYRNNKNRFVRLIMSDKKRFKSYNEIINNTNIDKLQITYYKYSKMLISVALPSDKKYTQKEEMDIFRFNKTI